MKYTVTKINKGNGKPDGKPRVVDMAAKPRMSGAGPRRDKKLGEAEKIAMSYK